MTTAKNHWQNKIVPGETKSLWTGTTPQTDFKPLEQDIDTDVLIIGGGITGITAALLLQEQGKKVTIIEQNRLVQDVTGNTTAKLTSQHGFIYHGLAINYGIQVAQAYGQSNQQAIGQIASIIEKYKIDCDFKYADAYAYTEDPNRLELVKTEADIAKEIELPASFVTETPLPFEVKGAVRFTDQAQFHPRKYLLALAKIIAKNGQIFEQTRALKIRGGKKVSVITDQGKIRANHVILATHFPFFDKGFFYARLYPHQAYATALKIKEEIPEGMYYSQDGNHHSIRSHFSKEGNFLIVSGGHHHSGQGGNTLNYYRDVLGYATKRFNIASVDYYWSTQDYSSIDGIPFIGKSPFSKNIYLATGFGGWGMTNATLAAKLITEQILKQPNPLTYLYKPSRYNIDSSKGILKENTEVMKQYFKGIFAKYGSNPKYVEDEKGRVLRLRTKRTAVYKDGAIVKTVSAICPHMGCTLNWNNAEKTWDCPCHGSRFDVDGKEMHGPAVWDLHKRRTA